MRFTKKHALSTLVVLSSLSLATMVLWFLVGHHFKTPHSFGNDTFSRSALGHSVFAEALERAGYTLEISRFQTSTRLQDVDLVILAEPYIQPQTKERTEELRDVMASGKPVLLIAPKRWGSPNSLEDDHISRHGLENPEDVKYAVDQALELTSEVSRVESLICAGLNIENAQTIKIGGFQPRGPCPEHNILVNAEQVWVLSDPDIIANHTTDSKAALKLALSVVDSIAGPGANLLIDETIHGHIQRPSLGEMLTKPPFVWIIIQFFILFFFAGWAGFGRFGPGIDAMEPQEPGKALLIQNTSELLSFSGHHGLLLQRYWDMMIADLMHHFQIRGDEQEVMQALDKIIQSRGLDWQIHKLHQRVDEFSDMRTSSQSRKIQGTVKAIYQLRSDLIKTHHRRAT